MGKPHWFSKHCSSASHPPIKAHDRNSITSACQLIEVPVFPLGDSRLVFRASLSCCMIAINYLSPITFSITQFYVWVSLYVLSGISFLWKHKDVWQEKDHSCSHTVFTHIISAYLWGSCVSTKEMFCVGVAAFDHEMYNLECKKFLSFSRQVEEDKTTTQETNLLSCVGGLNSWEERIL